MAATDLRKKYGAKAVKAGTALQPKTFAKRLAQRDRLDQHFTRLWLDFTITGVNQRSVLDTRTRLLVQIGQYTMTKSHPMLEEAIRAAFNAKVKPRDILEIVLQCIIYGGHTAVDPAIAIFEKIAKEKRALAAIQKSQLPLDGNDKKRSLAEERKKWDPADAASPVTKALIEEHGWLGVSSGLMLRPKHHIKTLAWQTALDAEWAGLWEDFIYQGLYQRHMIDDRTRLLCMVGNCVSVNEAVQGRAHMRGSMRAGAKPREVMEVILQSSTNFGMPSMLASLRIFVEVMREDGRLAEIGNPPAAD